MNARIEMAGLLVASPLDHEPENMVSTMTGGAGHLLANFPSILDFARAGECAAAQLAELRAMGAGLRSDLRRDNLTVP